MRLVIIIIEWISELATHTLSGRTGNALVWHTSGRAFVSRLLQQVLRFVGRVNTVQYVELRVYCPSPPSQLDLPSLTPLSVAGCGRLQLGAPHWATSVNYCK